MQRYSTPMFVLNRCGMSELQLCEAIQRAVDDIFDSQADEDQDEQRNPKVIWVSKFGRMPEQPHAFVILDSEEMTDQILSKSSLKVYFQDQEFNLEIDRCTPLEAKSPDLEPRKVCVTGLPKDIEQEELREEITQLFFPIAMVKQVIIPKTYTTSGTVFVEFYDEISAGYVAKVARFATFRGVYTVRCSFAKSQGPRE